MTLPPADKAPDSSFALLREGFLFITNRCRKYKTSLFKTRLMLEKAYCMQGREAAQLFYDPEYFERAGAVPGLVQDTLFGRDAVQTMDGARHQHRKSLFLSITAPEKVEHFAYLLDAEWRRAIGKWMQRPKHDPVILFHAAQEILCRAVCAWTGVPLPDAEAAPRAHDLFLMIDAFGSVGLRHWRGRFARRRCEKWIGDMVEETRAGVYRPGEETALYAIAWHRTLEGVLLSRQMAARELLNILRPTVAISYYIAFAALALHIHPACRDKLRQDKNDYIDLFIDEVRRFFPFAPFLGARARRSFTWQGCPFRQGQLAVLDLYGTDHSPQLWHRPESFNPERFADRPSVDYALIPQGGGDAATGHRCPGENITTAALQCALYFLINVIDYRVPGQDFSYNLSRMPTYPRSGFVIDDIRPRASSDEMRPAYVPAAYYLGQTAVD